jgi:hypothetical protein
MRSQLQRERAWQNRASLESSEAFMRLRTGHALIVLSSLASSLAVAQTYPAAWSPKKPPRLIEDRLRLEVGASAVSMDTQVRVDPSVTEPGTKIAAEDDLGLDDFKVLPYIELTLLPGEHHLVRLSAFSVRRSAQNVIDEQIVFDDEVYEANERVDSTLNIALVGLTYGYRFIAVEKGELAATFGIQIAEVEANAVVRSRVVREAESGVAPIPLAGLEGRFSFSSRWSAEARVQYLGGAYEDIEAFIFDARAALTWRQNPHLIWGLGYHTFRIKVDSEDEDNSGRVDMSFDGPQLFLRASL